MQRALALVNNFRIQNDTILFLREMCILWVRAEKTRKGPDVGIGVEWLTPDV